jgi:hypothetical protein
MSLVYHYSPKIDPLDNKFSLFNDIMVTIYLYVLLALGLSDLNREILGFALLGIVFLSILVNILKTVVMFIIKFRRLRML